MTYLSFSDGKYRVVHQGLPVCADTTIEQALAAAKQFKLRLSKEAWNGGRGEWVHLHTIEELPA